MKKYRISVNLNRVTTPYEDDFEKTRLYHLKHGVDIEFTFKQVDVSGYQSVIYTHLNGFKQYILAGADTLIALDDHTDADMFVFDEAEWATPPGSPFPLRPDTPTGSCIPINGKPFISVATYPDDHERGVTWVQIAHEIMHSYVQNAYFDGIAIPDVMDTYLYNQEPDHPEGNFAKQWEFLKLYLRTEDKEAAMALSPLVTYNEDMAKRSTTLSPKKKSRHSRKTQKRLGIKKLMLEKKKASRKSK
jgi:hypothetical protein